MSTHKTLPKRRIARKRAPNVMQLYRTIAPAHTVRVLRYSQQFGSTGVGATPSVQQFRLNDCYDPDYTGSGHQPMGFDQYMTLYSTFRVLSTKVHLRASQYAGAVANTNSQPSFNGIVGFFARPNDTLAITTVAQALEQPGCRFEQLPNAGVASIDMEIDHPTAFGLTREQYIADSQMVGTAAGTPTRWTVGSVFTSSANPGVYAQSIFITMLLELEVRFEGPLILGTS